MVKINGTIGFLKHIINSEATKGSKVLHSAVSTPPVFRGKILKEIVDNTGDSVVLQNAKSLLNTFLDGSSPEFEKAFKTFDFGQFGREGIPLKYQRGRFIQDIAETLADIPHEEQRNILAKFNLKIGYGDIDGIPNLAVGECKTVQEKQIKGLIEKFYKQNGAAIKDTSIKQALDSVVKEFPEFNMTIGKVQHPTHIYSVDIHSLKVLQSAMNNPLYKNLSPEGKKVLKLTALMHDFGKKGNMITPGHAIDSRKEAELLLNNYNFPEKIKERVLNQIEHHHWFEKYNTGQISADDVVKIFKTEEDLNIAKMLAKGDFEAVSPVFHLGRMNPLKILTQEEFDEVFASKMAQIKYH